MKPKIYNFLMTYPSNIQVFIYINLYIQIQFHCINKKLFPVNKRSLAIYTAEGFLFSVNSLS